MHTTTSPAILFVPESESSLDAASIGAAALRAAQNQARVPSETLLRGKSVVVIDDDPMFSPLSCELLEALGAAKTGEIIVQGESNAERIAAQIYALQPDLVLSDFNMGSVTGAQVLRAIRSRYQLEGKSCPVLIGNTGKESSLHFQGTHDGFLAKPFTYDQLGNEIERCYAAKASSPPI